MNKSKKSLLAALLCAALLSGCTPNEQGSTPTNSNITSSGSDKSSSSDKESSTKTEESSSSKETSTDSAPESSEDSSVDTSNKISNDEPPSSSGVSDNPLSDILQLENSSTVNDDKTGKWRYNTTTDGTFLVEEHIDEYYKNYFKSDDEIHFIINFTNLTVARINYFGGDEFYVDYYEHIENEEHHADLMCSGQPLNKYIVNKATGEIEKINDSR